jgi:hypothetical protein
MVKHSFPHFVLNDDSKIGLAFFFVCLKINLSMQK